MEWPCSTGTELYATGYSGNAKQILQDADGFWQSKIIFTERHPVHHLLAGTIDESHAGLEPVTCGHGC